MSAACFRVAVHASLTDGIAHHQAPRLVERRAEDWPARVSLADAHVGDTEAVAVYGGQGAAGLSCVSEVVDLADADSTDRVAEQRCRRRVHLIGDVVQSIGRPPDHVRRLPFVTIVDRGDLEVVSVVLVDAERRVVGVPVILERRVAPVRGLRMAPGLVAAVACR